MFDFFLVPPHLTFAVADTQYLVTFAVMLVVGLLVAPGAAVGVGKADVLEDAVRLSAVMAARKVPANLVASAFLRYTT